MRPVDRLIELDIDALGGAGFPLKISTVVSRLLPLWRDASSSGGTAGLILNLGWLMDPIVLYTGDPFQKLPIRSARLAAYAEITYRQLGELIEAVRAEAAAQGIDGLRVGMLVLGIGEFVNEIVRAPGTGTAETMEAALYQERGEWFARHPELFPFSSEITLHGPGIDWRQPLAADSQNYAARPRGITAGDSFHSFLAEQWAELCRTVGFDLLLLRDETTTPVHAGRMDFDGSAQAATPAEIDEWTDALISLTTTIKASSPGTMLVLYSSGLSPTVELRYGRLDIARVVAEGDIDAWVDQTWGGAWQDWWDAGWQGWSFQLTNLLARAALIAEGNLSRSVPCRHYPLIQLLDGWEPYDTLRDYPRKLMWGIWAFLHASTRSNGVDSTSAGVYLAVGNDRTGMLIPEPDVRWVAETLSDATESASALERVVGPILIVPERERAELASPFAESVEDACGFLGKWGIPVLVSASSRVVGAQDVEGAVISAVDNESGTQAGPVLVVGAPEDLSAPSHFGLEVSDDVAPAGYRRGIAGLHRWDLKPWAWPYMGRRNKTAPGSSSEVIYDGEDGPTAVRTRDRIWWLPPHVANGADRRLTHYQVGTVDPHIAVARALTDLRGAAGLIRIESPARHETVSFHAWVSAGTLHVLLGNVESGWIGDSRFPRTVVLRIPQIWLDPFEAPELVLRDGSRRRVAGGVVHIDVGSEGFELGRLAEASSIGDS